MFVAAAMPEHSGVEPPSFRVEDLGVFGGMASGNVVLVGGVKFNLPDIAPGPAPADGATLASWVARDGGNLKCGPFAGHETCLTGGGHDLGFALVFNGLAAPGPSAPREFHLAYDAVQLRNEPAAVVGRFFPSRWLGQAGIDVNLGRSDEHEERRRGQ